MNNQQKINAESIVDEILELIKDTDWESVHTYEKKFYVIQKYVRGVTKLPFENEDNINISKALYKKFLFLIDPHTYKYKDFLIKNQNYQEVIDLEKNDYKISDNYIADGLISKEKYDEILSEIEKLNLSGLNDIEKYQSILGSIEFVTGFDINSEENAIIGKYILFNTNIITDNDRKPEYKNIEIEAHEPYSEKITIMDACDLAIVLFDKFSTLSNELLSLNVSDYLDKIEKNPKASIYDDCSVDDDYDEESYKKLDVDLFNFIIRVIKLNKEFTLIYNVDPDEWEDCVNEYYDFFMRYNKEFIDKWIDDNKFKMINSIDFEDETNTIFNFFMYKMGRFYMDLIEEIVTKVDEYINNMING
jgi:hypothetical protein